MLQRTKTYLKIFYNISSYKYQKIQTRNKNQIGKTNKQQQQQKLKQKHTKNPPKPKIVTTEKVIPSQRQPIFPK